MPMVVKNDIGSAVLLVKCKKWRVKWKMGAIMTTIVVSE